MKYLEITSETNKLAERCLSISTLQINIKQDNPTTGDRLVVDADQRLEELIVSGELPGGELIKIDGRTSLPVGYTILHKIAHLYSAVAVRDIRLGYIVVVSTNPKYHLGDLLDDNNEVVSRFCGGDTQERKAY